MPIIFITRLILTNRYSFCFRPIHCHTTENLICSMKNKSSNLNTVPVKILKSICDIISPCLTNIINRSLTTGVFPDSLKRAFVTPIPKEGDKSNLSNNYRPISVFPVFIKVFEKVAYTQLYDYLENNSSLHNQQYGFRAKNSTILRPFCIFCSTCISIKTLVILYFLCSWIFSTHLIVLTTSFCCQS